MNKHLLALTLLTPAAFGLATASARADCATSKNDFEDVYCQAKTYIDSDGDLNRAYKALTGGLDADGKAALKKGQLIWLKSRNGRCGQTESDGYYVDLSCAVDTTRKRTAFLRDRKAECDSGACDLAKLAGSE